MQNPPSYTTVEMPVDIDGKGPEMNPQLVARVHWEVLDDVNVTVAIRDTRRDADYVRDALNMGKFKPEHFKFYR